MIINGIIITGIIIGIPFIIIGFKKLFIKDIKYWKISKGIDLPESVVFILIGGLFLYLPLISVYVITTRLNINPVIITDKNNIVEEKIQNLNEDVIKVEKEFKSFHDVFNFFNQGWVGSLIGLVGIILGGVGIFSYKISRSTAKPSYQKSSFRLIGRKENNLPKDVTVIFKRKEVDRLTKTTLILWNNGTEVLNGEDVISTDSLQISFTDGDNILSYKVLKQTKDVNNFELLKNEAFPHRLLINFSYLDPNDGIVLEILHDSKERYPEVTGTIRGLPKGFEDLGRVYPNRPVKVKHPLNILLSRPKLVFGGAIIVGLGMVIFGLLPQEIRDVLVTDSHENKYRIDQSLFFVILGIVYAAMPASILWIRRKKYPKQLEIEEVEP